MRLPFSLALTLLVLPPLLAAPPAAAVDERTSYSIKEALDSPVGRKRVRADVALYFAGQAPPADTRPLGQVDAHRRGTIGMVDTGTSANTGGERFPNTISGQHDRLTKEACVKAFVVVLSDLQVKARRAGADAVIELKSNFRGQELASDSQFLCGHGVWRAHVALHGQMAKLAR